MRNKFTKALDAETAKKEMTQLIVAFNSQADKNLLIMEDRIALMKKLNEEIEVNLKDYHRLHSLHSGRNSQSEAKNESTVNSVVNSAPAADNIPAKTVYAGKKIKKKIQKKNQPAMPSAEPRIRAYTDGLDNYFLQHEEEIFEQLSVEKKIAYLMDKKYTDRAIAQKLNLSISEINMILEPRASF